MNKRLFRSLKRKRHQQRVDEKREAQRAEKKQQQEEVRRQKGCNGKDKLTHAVARQRARALSLQLNASLQPYECEFCGFWHVGHT